MAGFSCPHCGEEVYVEELIDGRCPLCGEQCGPSEGEFDVHGSQWEKEKWLISLQATEGLKAVGLSASGAESLAERLVGEVDPSSLQGHQPVFKSFRWGLKTGLRDYFRVKTCTFCGRKHLLVGGKLLEGQMRIEPEDGDVAMDADIHWVCRNCGSRTPRSALG